MKKDQLYIFTLAALVFIVLLIGSISTHFMLKISIDRLMEQQLETSKREAREIANLLWLRIQDGVEKNKVIEGLQQTIENTGVNGNFICMYNQQGIEICHPEPSKIGQIINFDNSLIKDIRTKTNQNSLLELLQSGNAGGGIREFKEKDTESEIIYVYPVKGTDWMVASHSQTTVHNKQIKQLKINIILLNTVAGTFIIILLFFAIRIIGKKYEKHIEDKNEALISEVTNLSKLNQNLIEQKMLVSEQQLTNVEKEEEEGKDEVMNNSRILVSWRDQLIPVPIGQIAYFYTELSITKMVCFDKCSHTVNLSLDEIFSRLNKLEYFRVNRQYIVSIKAIDSIYKYGANQLKIDITPKPATEIFISKHKAAEFKKWLNA